MSALPATRERESFACSRVFSTGRCVDFFDAAPSTFCPSPPAAFPAPSPSPCHLSLTLLRSPPRPHLLPCYSSSGPSTPQANGRPVTGPAADTVAVANALLHEPSVAAGASNAAASNHRYRGTGGRNSYTGGGGGRSNQWTPDGGRGGKRGYGHSTGGGGGRGGRSALRGGGGRSQGGNGSGTGRGAVRGRGGRGRG